MGQNQCQVVSNEYLFLSGLLSGQDRQGPCWNLVYLITHVHFDYTIPSDFLFRLSTLTNKYIL